MTQNMILEQLSAHDEQALERVMNTYGTILTRLAANIVGEAEAQACVNEALLRAWNAIPPEQPKHLQAYLCRLVRNVAFDVYRSETAQKRGGTELDSSLEELSEVVGDSNDPAAIYEQKVIIEAIQSFMKTLPHRERTIFLARYFYCLPIAELAKQLRLREGTVKSVLHRTRERLKRYLKQEELL